MPVYLKCRFFFCMFYSKAVRKNKYEIFRVFIKKKQKISMFFFFCRFVNLACLIIVFICVKKFGSKKHDFFHFVFNFSNKSPFFSSLFQLTIKQRRKQVFVSFPEKYTLFLSEFSTLGIPRSVIHPINQIKIENLLLKTVTCQNQNNVTC